MKAKTYAQTPQGRVVDVEELARRYRQTFGCPVGGEVLLDLAQKCFADHTTWDADPRTHAFNEGARAVWLHINKFLGYTPEQVAKMYRGIPILLEPPEN